MATTTERKATEDELRKWRDELDGLADEKSETSFFWRTEASMIGQVALVASLVLWAVGKHMPFALLAAMQVAILGVSAVWLIGKVREHRQFDRAMAEGLRADIEDGRVRETRREIREALLVIPSGVSDSRLVFVLSSDGEIVHFLQHPEAPRWSGPRRTLVEVRGLASGDITDLVFEGERVDPGPVRAFLDGHGDWALRDEPYKGSWADLRAMLEPTR